MVCISSQGPFRLGPRSAARPWLLSPGWGTLEVPVAGVATAEVVATRRAAAAPNLWATAGLAVAAAPSLRNAARARRSARRNKRLADAAAMMALPEGDARGTQVVIVPGNGVESDIRGSNWYGWLEENLLSAGIGRVGLSEMPDPFYAREEVWLPFIVDNLAGGEAALARTVIVGHSSGAAAAMRLAERCRLQGMVLVAAYSSDMGYRSERASGYFSRPWRWDRQQQNCNWIVQFASTDDPFLPLEAEQRFVRDALSPKVEYFELDGRSHFFEPFGELLEVLLPKLGLPRRPL